MENRLRKDVLLLAGAALLIAPGCPRATKPTLPEEIPTPPEVQFTARDEGWPPRPRGRTEVTNVPWTARAGALTETMETELRNTATQDARVRGALGERYGYVTAAEVEPDKERPRDAGQPLRARLTFYSYTNNVAVEVLMRGREVESVNRREGYQPPEGAEEIKLAISLAEQDSRLHRAVQGMTATAILTYPERDHPGYGHRILHVSFSAQGEDVPRYYALVDLTAQRVLTAGPVGEK